MGTYLNNLAKLYCSKWLKITNLDKKEYLAKIDFTKPWWAVFLKEKLTLCIILSGRIIATTVITLLPLFIKSAITSQKYSSFLFLLMIWVCSESWRYVTVYIYSVHISRIISGLKYSAYKFFLTVDPIYHFMRVSGKLFAKIERCSKGYDKFIDTAVYDLLPIIVGMVTVIISFFTLHFMLGVLSLVFLLFITFLNVSMVLFNSLAFEKRLIKSDDSVKASSMESLMRIELVRSAFATNELNRNVRARNSYGMAVFGTYWVTFFTAMVITRFVYALSVCSLGAYIIMLVKSGTISIESGIAFLATYVHGTYHSMKIGKRMQKIIQSVTRIKDLFSFARKFGKQTFPVLKEDISKKYSVPTSDVISVNANNLFFSYEKVAIFKGHNLNMSVAQAQKNKLYGVIGPSGVGKTTLISILGGQLRPAKGQIYISGIPIYEINDNVRRKLIALQGQSASSLSGTVKDNLLLGIPKKRAIFTDSDMMDVLKKVGVWNIFKDKDGLDSMIGEGGLNLSVGQRQRLNFASLYMRTKYFKPLLVMIDEPTSSLDEVSEQAITDMIDELAKDFVVFVIAHRLNTLDAATGILDCSLIPFEKELIFYNRDELLKKSPYYQKLIRGEVAIEE